MAPIKGGFNTSLWKGFRLRPSCLGLSTARLTLNSKVSSHQCGIGRIAIGDVPAPECALSVLLASVGAYRRRSEDVDLLSTRSD